MFRVLGLFGVASAAVIESRPHEHLQIANAQLQNATDAVIKTAAVAGLAYAGAYMAGLEAGMTTSGSSYDSSRKSQEASTGAKYCNTRERNPLNFQCSAKHWNGKHVNPNNADSDNAKSDEEVGIRNFWCCQAPDLGAQYEGNLDGVCTNYNWASQGWAQEVGKAAQVEATTTANIGAPTTCVYHGPCVTGGFVTGGSGDIPGSFSGSCTSDNVGVTNDGGTTSGLLGGIPGGFPPGQKVAAAAFPVDSPGDASHLTSVAGASFGPAMWGMTSASQCCMKLLDGETSVQASQLTTTLSQAFNKPQTLNFGLSFCTPTGYDCPDGYEASTGIPAA